MSEKKRSRGSKQTYRHKQNAINITLYDPHGETVPATARHKAEEAILQIAVEHQLLISIATT